MPWPVYRLAMLTTRRRFASQQVVLRGLTVVGDQLQLLAQLRGEHEPGGVTGECLGGEEPGLDALGEVDLLGGGEELRTADAVQVGADQVCRDPAVRVNWFVHVVDDIRADRFVLRERK